MQLAIKHSQNRIHLTPLFLLLYRERPPTSAIVTAGRWNI